MQSHSHLFVGGAIFSPSVGGSVKSRCAESINTSRKTSPLAVAVPRQCKERQELVMEGEARKLLVSSSAGSEFLHFLAGIWSWVAHKFDQLLCEFLHFLAGIWSWVVHEFDQLLPPETRSETLHHWAHVGLTIVLPVSLVLLCLYHCCCCRPFRPCICLRRFFSCFFCRCCCCCCSKPGEEEEGLDPLEFEELMMKAPGRGGAMMPRGVFEGNPRGYFRDLRANKDLPKYW